MGSVLSSLGQDSFSTCCLLNYSCALSVCLPSLAWVATGQFHRPTVGPTRTDRVPWAVEGGCSTRRSR